MPSTRSAIQVVPPSTSPTLMSYPERQLLSAFRSLKSNEKQAILRLAATLRGPASRPSHLSLVKASAAKGAGHE